MQNPKVLENFLNAESVIKTNVSIETESIINLTIAVVLMLVVAFLAYKLIIKE